MCYMVTRYAIRVHYEILYDVSLWYHNGMATLTFVDK